MVAQLIQPQLRMHPQDRGIMRHGKTHCTAVHPCCHASANTSSSWAEMSGLDPYSGTSTNTGSNMKKKWSKEQG